MQPRDGQAPASVAEDKRFRDEGTLAGEAFPSATWKATRPSQCRLHEEV